MKSEYNGNIENIRVLEDCIRKTKKYTEGIGTMRIRHPVQGEEFPSKVLCKYYEVYPDLELSWDMPAGKALDWLWGDTTCIDIKFIYDYRMNKAGMKVRNGTMAITHLVRTIPGFKDALIQVIKGEKNLVEDR